MRIADAASTVSISIMVNPRGAGGCMTGLLARREPGSKFLESQGDHIRAHRTRLDTFCAPRYRLRWGKPRLAPDGFPALTRCDVGAMTRRLQEWRGGGGGKLAAARPLEAWGTPGGGSIPASRIVQGT